MQIQVIRTNTQVEEMGKMKAQAMRIKTQGKKQGSECTIKCFNIGKNYTPYKSVQGDSNGHGFHFFNCYHYKLWIIHIQSTTNFRILCENLYLL